MIKKIRKCAKCYSYTLRVVCCGSATVKVHPARFKPNIKLLRKSLATIYKLKS